MLLIGLGGGLLGARGLWLVAAAALGWPAALVMGGVGAGMGFMVGALALAAANAGLGYLVGMGARRLWRRMRTASPRPVG